MSDRSRPLLHRLGEAGASVGRRPPRRAGARLALQLALALVIFGFLVFTVADQWDELRQRRIRFEGGWLVPAAAVLAAFYVLMGFGWDLVIRFLGHRLSPARAQMVWGQSLLARYVPGTVLFVLGRVVLAEREGVPRRTTLAAIVYEIGLQFGAAAMIGAYFLITHPDLSDQPLRWAVLAVVPAGLAVLHPRAFAPLANAVLRRLGRESLPAVMPFRGVVAMLLYYALTWAVIGLGLFFVARAVYPLAASELPVVASAQALAFCAAVLSVVFPSGLGVRDGAFAWAVKVALPGQSFALGAAIAIAARLAITIVELAYVAAISAIGRRAGIREPSSAGPAEPPAGAETP